MIIYSLASSDGLLGNTNNPPKFLWLHVEGETHPPDILVFQFHPPYPQELLHNKGGAVGHEVLLTQPAFPLMLCQEWVNHEYFNNPIRLPFADASFIESGLITPPPSDAAVIDKRAVHPDFAALTGSLEIGVGVELFTELLAHRLHVLPAGSLDG
jgi:hypothetical protein